MNEPHQLKVLHIASGDLWAGAEVQLYTLAKALQKMPETCVSVILLNHGALEEKLLEAGIRVFVLDESRLNGFHILHLLVRTIREQKPDIIHTHRVKENILGSLAGLLAGRTRSIRTAHGAPEHRPPWFHVPKRLIIFMDWLCGSYLQQRIVAVSEDLAGILEKEFPQNHIQVIENGIDLLSISGPSKDSHSVTATGRDVFRIGFAGRLVPVKRVDLYIETARYILDHYPNLKTSFQIYGDGPLLQPLEQLSQKLGTDNIVHFEGHCEDILDRIRNLDVLLMTSDHEGLPMVLLEAMAARTAIIAHAVGGIPQLLDWGSCGVLVEEQKASEYGDKIHHLAVSPHLLAEISENAFARVRNCYSAEQNARSYASIYSELVT
jgi:glycosyltransferase involved in cell wall biosynthesis